MREKDTQVLKFLVLGSEFQLKALITGISGFVGTHLCEHLLTLGYEIVGISRSEPVNVKDLNVNYITCDINDTNRLEGILRRENPHEIYHLAGTAFIPDAHNKPRNAYNTIVNGTLNLYEVVKDLKLCPKILYVGSGEVYGDGLGKAFTESDLLQPGNSYAGAKACADLISEQYTKSYGLNIIRARPFNHTGPGQSSHYVCSSFAKQITEMEMECRDTIRIGNINIKRDFLDVRDVINAYCKLMSKGIAGEAYNVSSNSTMSISEILDLLFQHSYIKQPKAEIDIDKVRNKEPIIRLGDNSKLIELTNWKPQYDLVDTMKEMLEFWRNNRKAGIS